MVRMRRVGDETRRRIDGLAKRLNYKGGRSNNWCCVH